MNEIRISLNEEDFSKLCLNGHIHYREGFLKNYFIPINQENFDKLTNGDIIDVQHSGKRFKIALQDIGLNKIMHYKSKSTIF